MQQEFSQADNDIGRLGGQTGAPQFFVEKERFSGQQSWRDAFDLFE
jgi:hypothetical protein